ncbi:hypothetical protein C8Q75DRAFT_758980 [Abortiporus biennis]|nr:hypothetical protein C8Q75DRAFT_758980 [Abortiporus biennis]
MAPVGEPKESPKPQPIGNGPFIVLFTICALCAIFLLWRRASALRSVVGHQLKRITGQEGTIRLSLDDGPSSHEFLSDDFDEDNEHLDNEPLAVRAQELRATKTLPPVPSAPSESVEAVDTSSIPAPPPKPL